MTTKLQWGMLIYGGSYIFSLTEIANVVTLKIGNICLVHNNLCFIYPLHAQIQLPFQYMSLKYKI